MGVDMSVPREILGADPKAPVTGRTHVNVCLNVPMPSGDAAIDDARPVCVPYLLDT